MYPSSSIQQINQGLLKNIPLISFSGKWLVKQLLIPSVQGRQEDPHNCPNAFY